MKLSLQTGENNPILRTIAKPIKTSELASLRLLGESMVKYVKNPKNKGIGLAAPQIGVSKRMIVVWLPKTREDETYPVVLMINPTILSLWREVDVDEEGCLSLPGIVGNVQRSTSIEVEWYDIKGIKMKKTISGFGARVIQHEVDHINWILISDKFLK